jgi:hypothetical protein
MAAALALELGCMGEELRVKTEFEHKVIHSNQARRGAKKASATKTEMAHREYEHINQAVAARKKKGGKQLSLTEARKRVATDLGFSYSKVLDAQRGGRKK